MSCEETMKKAKKKAMTLLEIMIVIFIIGIIGSVIGYNMKGSLDEGKAFKTREGARQIYEILTLEKAKTNKNISNVKKTLENSGLVRKVDDLMKDGWGKAYTITFEGDDVIVRSDNYNSYAKKKNIDVEPFMGGNGE